MIAAIARALLAGLWRPVAAVAAGLAMWLGGRRSARQGAALRAAEDYARKRKDMDDAQAAMGDDPASARRWLSERDRNTR